MFSYADGSARCFAHLSRKLPSTSHWHYTSGPKFFAAITASNRNRGSFHSSSPHFPHTASPCLMPMCVIYSLEVVKVHHHTPSSSPRRWALSVSRSIKPMIAAGSEALCSWSCGLHALLVSLPHFILQATNAVAHSDPAPFIGVNGFSM